MKRLIVYVVSLVASLCGVAQGSAVIPCTIKSDVLGQDKSYVVYLPEGYQTSGRNYPVLYLLHGAWGKDTDWTQHGDLKEIADLAIRSGAAVPMIVVMPDARGTAPDFAGPRMGYFSVPGWDYERFFHEELIPAVDSIYRTIPDKKHRAIAGLSMGGGGATVYAQRYPQFYGTSCSLSGLVGMPPARNDSMFDPEFNKSVRRTDPTGFVRDAAGEDLESLRSVRWFADCGDDDFLANANVDYYKAMKEKNIPIEYRMRDGNHNWTYWKTALPAVLQFCSTGFSDMSR